MTITENKTPISIELVIDGRLDTGTAPELEVKLKEISKDTQTLYLNMKNVQYVSSSGLRVILLIQRCTEDSDVNSVVGFFHRSVFRKTTTPFHTEKTFFRLAHDKTKSQTERLFRAN